MEEICCNITRALSLQKVNLMMKRKCQCPGRISSRSELSTNHPDAKSQTAHVPTAKEIHVNCFSVAGYRHQPALMQHRKIQKTYHKPLEHWPAHTDTHAQKEKGAQLTSVNLIQQIMDSIFQKDKKTDNQFSPNPMYLSPGPMLDSEPNPASQSLSQTTHPNSRFVGNLISRDANGSLTLYALWAVQFLNILSHIALSWLFALASGKGDKKSKTEQFLTFTGQVSRI